MILEVTFAVLALAIIGSAVMVLRSHELVHSTIWLAAMLLAVAGIFLTVGAEFLAVIQLLVYIGAVVTLILFTVMLTIPEERVDFLESLRLPPGVHIESIEEIQRATPAWSGAGPYKTLKETNPRVPTRTPDNLYGVSLVDGEFASANSPRDKTQEGGK